MRNNLDRIPNDRTVIAPRVRSAMMLILASALSSCATAHTNSVTTAVEQAPDQPMMLTADQIRYLSAACQTLAATNPREWASPPQGLHLSARARTEADGIEYSAYVNSLPAQLQVVCESPVTSLDYSPERASAIHDLLCAYYNRPTADGQRIILGSPEFASRRAHERPIFEALVTRLEQIIRQ